MDSKLLAALLIKLSDTLIEMAEMADEWKVAPPPPAPPAEKRDLITQDEATLLLGGIDRVTIWRMVKRGDLKQVRIGRRSFIQRASIDAFIAKQVN